MYAADGYFMTGNLKLTIIRRMVGLIAVLFIFDRIIRHFSGGKSGMNCIYCFSDGTEASFW